MIVSDFIAERLVRLGISHVFGVGGANIEDVFVAIQRRRPRIRALLAKHEHGAGTAADAFARVRGGLGVVLATSGGGAMNLVHSLAEARASLVPILAIVGDPPSELQGRGAFQDTSGRTGGVDAERVLGAVSVFAVRVTTPQEVPRLLETAIDSALAKQGPAVLVMAKDLQRADIPASGVIDAESGKPQQGLAVDPKTLQVAVEFLRARPVMVIAGDEVARAPASAELSAFAETFEAGVAVAPDARDAFDNRDAHFLGVAGAMGHDAVKSALVDAAVVVLAGTRLPLLARMGLEEPLREKVVVSFGQGTPFVSSPNSVHVVGPLRSVLSSLVELAEKPVRAASAAQPPPVALSVDPPHGASSAAVLAALGDDLPDDSVVIVDAGNTGAMVAHHLRAPRRGRWLLAMGMAGMGYAFGAGVGVACATGRRCTVLTGDGAFYMHGLEIHTAVEHDLPITYVIFNNSAHGMCLVRERLLLREDAGYNAFRRSHIGAGLRAMFPGLSSVDCTTTEEVKAAFADSLQRKGPSVIVVELRDVEVPPFAAFQAAAGSVITTVSRGEGHEDD